MANMWNMINHVREEFADVDKRLDALDKHLDAIDKIISKLKKVSEQTNTEDRRSE
jgi:methyl-accepting chemotaxis protein